MAQPVLDFVGVWTVILGLAVFFYVLLDGFDLGVGILYGLAPDSAARSIAMNSIAPIWDGNETWLVFGGLALLAAFPLAFAIIIPAVYFPILVMLLALIFRGVAFEFRYKDAKHRTAWDHGFCYGSSLATFAQGMVLGTFIQGFKVEGRHFAGSSFDFITPFSLLTGVALLFGYALLGAGWLVIKTEGELQDWARRQGRRSFIGVAIAIAAVSLCRAEIVPFAGAVGLFLMSYIGIAISLWPMIVPHHFTLWEAASSPSTQAFLLVGTLFLLPVIFMYTGWSYWVFRGKVRGDTGYH
jgi:cytochrome d ubiquinol oxidase subunit II